MIYLDFKDMKIYHNYLVKIFASITIKTFLFSYNISISILSNYYIIKLRHSNVRINKNER